MTIDISLLRASRGGDGIAVRESQKKRFAKDQTLVDRVIELDENWCKLQSGLESLKMEKNGLQAAVTERKKKENLPPSDEQKGRMKAIKIEEEKLGKLAEEAEQARDKELPKIGNLVHESVPISNDEANNEVVSTWGETRGSEGLESHAQILWRIGGYNPDAGVKVAGHRGYFLTGPGVLLNQALINYALRFLVQRNYTPIQPPYFMNKRVMQGVAQLEEFDEALYHVSALSRGANSAAAPAPSGKEKEDDEDKYLIATSEQPICAFHANEVLEEKSLPIRYAGMSTCFRKEAGKHGRDTWGIFRVHQFDKIEQFVICAPEDSWRLHEEMLKASEDFLQSLGIPYRVVNIVSGELNNAAAKKYDVEGWFPNYGEYKELVSCSNCTDYQSRSMDIKCGFSQFGQQQQPEGAKQFSKRFVHMLNATLCALTRTICAILENGQGEKVLEDGTVVEGVHIPAVLVPFMGGVDFLPYVKPYRETIMEKNERKKTGQPGSTSGKPAAVDQGKRAPASASAVGGKGAYTVGKDTFKTSVAKLKNKHFKTLQEYASFLNA